MKTCTRCLNTLPLGLFHKRSDADYALADQKPKTWCKFCDNQYKWFLRYQKRLLNPKIKPPKQTKEERLIKLKEYNKRPEVIKRTSKQRLKYYHKNPLLKLSHGMRTRLNCALNGQFKPTSTIKAVGCTWPELKNFLERQFEEGMSWENHTKHGWHIDHIIPLNTAKTAEEMIKLCHFSNLRPLWAVENCSRPKDGSDLNVCIKSENSV